MMSPPKIRLVYPEFESSLTNIIIELEKIRQKHRYIGSDVKPIIFFQLKALFHMLESVGSVRIEGNNTTISEYIDHKIGVKKSSTSRPDREKVKEIENVEKALEFIDRQVTTETKIDRILISEIHKLVVDGLDPFKEGDRTPGKYREYQVQITDSTHVPPSHILVSDYMEELLDFINEINDPKDHMLSVAMAHHRFAWIHPFGNGNGRVVRLLTYAMLIKQGFTVRNIINPTAIFCNNRDIYYEKLALADTYEPDKLVVWSDYVLSSLLDEINKIDKLLNKNYLVEKIVLPALKEATKNQYITDEESKILKKAVEIGEFMASDISSVVEHKYPVEISRRINRLKEKKMITNVPGKKRIYVVSFYENLLMRSLIGAFQQEGFVNLQS